MIEVTVKKSIVPYIVRLAIGVALFYAVAREMKWI